MGLYNLTIWSNYQSSDSAITWLITRSKNNINWLHAIVCIIFGIFFLLLSFSFLLAVKFLFILFYFIFLICFWHFVAFLSGFCHLQRHRNETNNWNPKKSRFMGSQELRFDFDFDFDYGFGLGFSSLFILTIQLIMMQSMRNGIEKHFVRQLGCTSICPQPCPALARPSQGQFSTHSASSWPKCHPVHANWVISQSGVCFCDSIYHLSFEGGWGMRWSLWLGYTLSTFSTFVLFLDGFLRVCLPKLYCDIYPTYLGRTQQPPVRVAGRRDPKMALACPAAAVHASPNGADVARHSCADVGPNHPIWESPPPLRLPLSAAPRWCCLLCPWWWSFNCLNVTYWAELALSSQCLRLWLLLLPVGVPAVSM